MLHGFDVGGRVFSLHFEEGRGWGWQMFRRLFEGRLEHATWRGVGIGQRRLRPHRPIRVNVGRHGGEGHRSGFRPVGNRFPQVERVLEYLL